MTDLPCHVSNAPLMSRWLITLQDSPPAQLKIVILSTMSRLSEVTHGHPTSPTVCVL